MVDSDIIPTPTDEYFINYIEETTIANELQTSERKSISPFEEYSCRLDASELVEEVIEILPK